MSLQGCFASVTRKTGGLSDEEQKRKVSIKRGQGKRACHAEHEKLMQMAGQSPKHTRKRIHQARKTFCRISKQFLMAAGCFSGFGKKRAARIRETVPAVPLRHYACVCIPISMSSNPVPRLFPTRATQRGRALPWQKLERGLSRAPIPCLGEVSW